MIDQEEIQRNFLKEVKTSQVLWALQDNTSEDWVVLDSVNYENTEVMPLWSTYALAKEHCIDEWASYTPAQITVSDWMEFWIEDLNEDSVIVGIDWSDNDECVEVELAEFVQALSEIERL